MRKPCRHDALPVGEILQKLIPRIEALRTDWFETLVAAWPDIVGEAIARHAQPARLDGTRLIIHVDDNVWLFELSRMARTPVLEGIRKRFGPNRVTDCLFALDPGRVTHRTINRSRERVCRSEPRQPRTAGPGAGQESP